ncbi:MAG: choline kinase family protein [Bacteroidota bacterium]
MQNLQTLIPPTSLAAVESALLQTFHTTAVQELILLTGGLSASIVYKMMVNGQSYVLKVDRPSTLMDDKALSGMEIAAKAGIAPQVYYWNKASGVAISQFIENAPLQTTFRFPGVLLPELARTIRCIHELPSFPGGNRLVETVDGLLAQFKEPGFEEYLTYYADIKKHYPWDDADRVPSHNDLNPGNIICDGEKIWIIDWDAAYQNDRYVDLAIAANFYAADDEQEHIFLAAYFGDALTDYHRARFFLMRQVCRIVYGVLLFKKGTLGQTLLNQALADLRSPRFADEINKMADIKTRLA